MTFKSGRTIIGAMLWASGVALALTVLWHVPDVRAAVPDNAGSCRVPRDLIIERPGAGGEPVSVGVAIFLVNLRNIRETSETFEAELTLRVNWKDPRLSSASLGKSLKDCKIKLEDIWDPAARFNNMTLSQRIKERGLNVDDDGMVRVEGRMVGTFTTNLNLREFPFDSQELKVDLSSFQYGPEDILFMDEGSDLRKGLKITGWNIMGNEAHTSGESGNETSHYTHVITVDRDETYMLLQLMPFLFIVIMAWGVFWLDPKDYGAQIGMATGAVFALIALLISMRQVLPKVTYLTRADELVVGCTILVFISLGEVVFVSRLVQDGKGDKARRVDFHARWIYLLFFVGILGVTMGR